MALAELMQNMGGQLAAANGKKAPPAKPPAAPGKPFPPNATPKRPAPPPAGAKG